jgi:hypothetical protein
MEEWNIGMMAKNKVFTPIIPSFQHSNLLTLRSQLSLRFSSCLHSPRIQGEKDCDSPKGKKTQTAVSAEDAETLEKK